ncbi:MAG: glycosyltransferase family 2 protein, partial [Verrucomicrobiota bacterium]
MSISVAICTYNRRELAMSCLESLLAQDADLAGITVVDNASEDGTREALEKAFGDRIMVIPSDHNLGSSGGFHLAIENACRESSDYVLLLDSDTELAPGALAAMVTYLEENPDVWVVGPKIYWPGTERRVQTFGTRIDWAKTELVQGHRDLAEGAAAQIIGTLEVDCVLACCALIRREVFAKVGNMDPRFFVYMDDVEWC